MRASHEHPIKGIARDFAPLEKFFRNLIPGETNELQSRYLLVGLKSEEKAKAAELLARQSENAARLKAAFGKLGV